MSRPQREVILADCWDRAIESFGTAWIFEQRAKRLNLKLSVLTYVGVLNPLTIGGLVGTFGREVISLQLLAVTGLLGLAQVVISLWAIVATWGDKQSTATERMVANYRFSDRYQSLAKLCPSSDMELRKQFDLIDTEEQGSSSVDKRQGITDAECRAGMRAALRQFQRACIGCKQVPAAMRSTRCDVCGNFSNSLLRLANKEMS